MNKKALICFIIIGSVLLTTIVSLSYNLNAQKKQNQDMLELAELDKKELEDQYQEFANQYGDMKDMITDKEISSQLGIQQTKAQQILKKIKVTDPHNAQELARLKKQLPSFKNVLKAYMNQLDSWRKTNSNLIAENARVKEQFDEATNHITGLNTQNRDLSYKVAIASQLNVDDVNLLFKNKRGKTTKKPKKAKTIEITFNIAKNPTAPKGNKNMTVVVKSPNKDYNTSKTIRYNGQRTPVSISIPLHEDEELEKGIYQVTILSNGKLLDKESYTIK